MTAPGVRAASGPLGGEGEGGGELGTCSEGVSVCGSGGGSNSRV